MPIAQLAGRLAGNRLHVVVFGPGYGESIAVHVPDTGWLVCDSLSGRGRAATLVPAAELLAQRQESAVMVILTHPHDDHVRGLDRLVTRFATGPVGVVGLHLAHEGFTEDDDAARVLATSNRLKALAAIHRYWRDHPQFKWVLTADRTVRPLGPATVEVLHPSSSFVAAGEPDPHAAPNAYSTPLLLEWGSTRLVLGADLPTREWDAVLDDSRAPALAEHHALKISHHGSKGSRAERLVLREHRDAVAVVTPWHAGRGILPKLEDAGGMPWILERRNGVALTSAGRALDRALPQPVELSVLAASVQRRSLPGGVGAVEVTQDYDPDECWVALTLTYDGEIDAIEYGREARLVTTR